MLIKLNLYTIEGQIYTDELLWVINCESERHLVIKTGSVKTSKSVFGINSDGLTEKSKTSGLIKRKEFFCILLLFHISL